MATFLRDYRPGDLGHCVALHATYYAHAWSFGAYFESKVASGMADFIQRLDGVGNGWWTAEFDGTYAGSNAIDGDDSEGAHLRWFILADTARGKGMGKTMMDAAMAHCRAQGFPLVYLDTFRGLDAARRLYERAGFRLVREREDGTWGTTVIEQRFEWTPR